MAEREQFVERDLSGARFVECDLSGVVMRGVEIAGMDIDAPWLSEGPGLQVNGVDVTPYVGRYERASVLMEVLAEGPTLRTTITGPLAELVPEPVEEYPMVPVGPALFVVKPPEAETWAPVTFYELPTGERYVHFGVRATPRVD